MKIVVGGSRYLTDEQMVFDVLDELHSKDPITHLAHGACQGADLLCAKWAEARGVVAKAYPADWDRWGRSAGPRRNAAMLVEAKPDCVVAFPGGAGTADLVRRATLMNCPVVRVGRYKE